MSLICVYPSFHFLPCTQSTHSLTLTLHPIFHRDILLLSLSFFFCFSLSPSLNLSCHFQVYVLIFLWLKTHSCTSFLHLYFSLNSITLSHKHLQSYSTPFTQYFIYTFAENTFCFLPVVLPLCSFSLAVLVPSMIERK